MNPSKRITSFLQRRSYIPSPRVQPLTAGKPLTRTMASNTPSSQAQPEPTSNQQSQSQEPSSNAQAPLPLPSPDSASTQLNVNGDGVKLDHLGPLVVNKDGTLSRIANWDKMAEIERQNTLRILGKRNQLRLGALRGEGKEEGAE